MVTTIVKEDSTMVICLSTDIATLDTTDFPNGAMMFCMDTNLTGFLDGSNGVWRFTDTTTVPAYVAPAEDDADPEEGGDAEESGTSESEGT